MSFQRTSGATDNVSDYESGGFRCESCQDRKPSFYSDVFDETEQEHPVDSHQINIAATKTRKDQSAQIFTLLRR